MSEETHAIRIQRYIEDGKGRVVWTVSPTTLDTILLQHGVNEVNQLPEDYLRDLCRRASQVEMQREFERIEENNPGRTAVIVGQDSSGNDVEVHSSDVGSELITGFCPKPTTRLIYSATHSTARLILSYGYLTSHLKHQ